MAAERHAAGHDVGPHPIQEEVAAEGEEHRQNHPPLAQKGIADGKPQKDMVSVSRSQNEGLPEPIADAAHPGDACRKKSNMTNGTANPAAAMISNSPAGIFCRPVTE